MSNKLFKLIWKLLQFFPGITEKSIQIWAVYFLNLSFTNINI